MAFTFSIQSVLSRVGVDYLVEAMEILTNVQLTLQQQAVRMTLVIMTPQTQVIQLHHVVIYAEPKTVKITRKNVLLAAFIAVIVEIIHPNVVVLLAAVPAVEVLIVMMVHHAVVDVPKDGVIAINSVIASLLVAVPSVIREVVVDRLTALTFAEGRNVQLIFQNVARVDAVDAAVLICVIRPHVVHGKPSVEVHASSAVVAIPELVLRH